MTDAQPPDEVRRLVLERTTARAARDWQRADALRDDIAALGWEVQDGAGETTVRPVLARSESAAEAEPIDEEATVDASVLVVAEDHPDDLARFVTALGAHRPAVPWELVVVANGPSYDVDEVCAAASLPVEPRVVRRDERLGWADAGTLALRQSRGAVAMLFDTSLEPIGDIVGPLLVAFDDPTVGLAGGWGLRTSDARQFHEAEPGEVDAVEAYALAVRRDALRAVGGFDRRFRFYRNADIDFSFAVRDAGWRAVRIADLPAVRHEHRGWTALPDEERDRLSRRNFYRFLDRWGRRTDLLLDATDQDVDRDGASRR